MPQTLTNATDFFLWTFLELTALFLVISFLVGLIQQWYPPEAIRRLLSGRRGYGVAVALGAVTPFCSCSTLPMITGLLRARAAFGPVMAFLFTSPLLNPFVVVLFWVTFGPKVTGVYALTVITAAVLGGELLQRLDFARFVKPDLFSGCTAAEPAPGRAAGRRIRARPLAREALNQFLSFAPYMALGVGIGAFVHGYVPTEWFSSLAAWPSLVVIPLAALLGAVLYLRASTMVPIAGALAAKGMSFGVIMSLAIGGAGASLPEMIMMKRLFRWPLMFAFLALVLSTATVGGFVFEQF